MMLTKETPLNLPPRRPSFTFLTLLEGWELSGASPLLILFVTGIYGTVTYADADDW